MEATARRRGTGIQFSWYFVVLVFVPIIKAKMLKYPVMPAGAMERELPFPYSGSAVTAATISMDASSVTEYNGADQDNVVVDIEGQGPELWSISRFNEGDFAPRIAPRRPYSQNNLGVPPGAKGFAAVLPTDPSVQAWRPHPEVGVLLATVAQNGKKWNDKAPFFYGTVAVSTDSSGYGYSMVDGQFGKSDPNCDVVVGKAGKLDEGNIDISIAWFPYGQGWKGGYIQSPGGGEASWLTPSSHAESLGAQASGIVTWDDHGARLKLPGVDASKDGMLFAISTDPGSENNDVNIVSTMLDGSAWKIQQREDNEADPKKFASQGSWMFSFVFIPFNANNLVGGHVSGGRGSTIAGTEGYSMQKLSTGVYQITLKDKTVTRRSGALLLQLCDHDRHNHRITKHAFLSYNVSAANSLIVECHTMERSSTEEDSFPFLDTDFYFAWIDFLQPLEPQTAHRDKGGSFGWGFFSGSAVIAAIAGIAFAYKTLLENRARRLVRRLSLIQPFADIVGEDLEEQLLGPATESPTTAAAANASNN